MPDIGFLDTLVKLATLGTSGISIFAIFWIGWLIRRTPANRNQEEHKTLRYFMLTCLVIAVISVASVFFNSGVNANLIDELELDNENLSDEVNAKQRKISQMQMTIESYESQQPAIKILAQPSTNGGRVGAVSNGGRVGAVIVSNGGRVGAARGVGVDILTAGVEGVRSEGGIISHPLISIAKPSTRIAIPRSLIMPVNFFTFTTALMNNL